MAEMTDICKEGRQFDGRTVLGPRYYEYRRRLLLHWMQLGGQLAPEHASKLIKGTVEPQTDLEREVQEVGRQAKYEGLFRFGG